MSRIIVSGPFLPGLALATKAGNHIPNYARRERPPAALQAMVEVFQRSHPNARLRSLTASYNCIGMVVASRRAWVDTDHLFAVLRDDGYQRLEKPEDAEIGDVAVYRRKDDVAHVAIIIHKNVLTPEANPSLFRVLSKWGGDGEYEHELSDVPETFGVPVEFWTDRRMP